MSKEDYLEFHKQFCKDMIEITAKKNADYTGSSDDPFANFRHIDHFGVATVEQGFFTRMTDKFSRIASFIKIGVLLVKDESIQDTLLDLANYSVLFAGYLKSQKMDRRKPVEQNNKGD